MLPGFHIKPIAAAVLLAVVATGPVLADTGIKEKVTVAPGRQITPQDEAVISSAAVKVLRHIASAREELQGDKLDTEKASQELAQAEKLLDIIAAALPTTRVKDRIWVAGKHLEYENSREILPDLVPIYGGLDELVSYLPTAKGHLDEADRVSEHGDKAKSQEQLEETDDALLYVETDLPLSSTRHLVTQAREVLAKGDAEAAERALGAAEDNVVFVSISFQSDLTQAKAALWRTWRDYNLGNREFAKANLDEAVRYLERVAKSDDEVERQAAADLVAEVRDLHQLIDVGDKGFGTKVKSSWHRLEALSERSAEYLGTGWQRLRAGSAGKKDLIEAKLQLAYGRIDHLYSEDDAAAKVDLAEAEGYLDSALGRSTPDLKDQVEAVASQVKALENGMGSGDSSAGEAAAFQQAEAQLATLIRQL